MAVDRNKKIEHSQHFLDFFPADLCFSLVVCTTMSECFLWLVGKKGEVSGYVNLRSLICETATGGMAKSKHRNKCP